MPEPPTPRENWGAEPWRRPTIPDGAEVVFSEHGRSINQIDHRSHWFVLVKLRIGGLQLLVKHGGGEDRIHIISPSLFPNLAALAPDDRYLAMYTFFKVHWEGLRQGREAGEAQWRAAVRDGRAHRRKMPGRDAYKVWIDPVPGTP